MKNLLSVSEAGATTWQTHRLATLRSPCSAWGPSTLLAVVQ